MRCVGSCASAARPPAVPRYAQLESQSLELSLDSVTSEGTPRSCNERAAFSATHDARRSSTSGRSDRRVSDYGRSGRRSPRAIRLRNPWTRIRSPRSRPPPLTATHTKPSSYPTSLSSEKQKDPEVVLRRMSASARPAKSYDFGFSSKVARADERGRRIPWRLHSLP